MDCQHGSILRPQVTGKKLRAVVDGTDLGFKNTEVSSPSIGRRERRASWPRRASTEPVSPGFQSVTFRIMELPLPLPHDHHARLAIPPDDPR